MALYSKLNYKCGDCGLTIDGNFNEVLIAIRLHEHHDWNKVRYEVLAEEKRNASST